jgi:hypothetical protein
VEVAIRVEAQLPPSRRRTEPRTPGGSSGDSPGAPLVTGDRRWEDIKKRRGNPPRCEQDLALGQFIYDVRTELGLSQRALAERMATTQSVIFADNPPKT